MLLGACQEVKGEAMAVNQADYTTVFVQTMGPEEKQQRHVVVRKWWCSTHTGNEVSSCVGSVAEGPCGLVWFLWDCVLPVTSQHFVGNGGP